MSESAFPPRQSARNPTPPVNRLALLGFGLLLIASLWSTARAQEAWLVTYGPGEEVWELFGHNALWLRDPTLGLDHTYSFGYFEMDRAGFYADFARGVMDYYGASAPVEREFNFYRQRGRSISIQRLDLTPQQFRALHKALHEAIYPHPQFYAYDYFRANCSTWLRDLINAATGDQLRPRLQNTKARHDFREHTVRMTQHRPWIQAGILLLMGPSVDRPVTAWEESFLPEALASWLDGIELEHGPLVAEREMVYDPGISERSESPRSARLLQLALGFGLGALMLLSIERRPSAGARVWRMAALLAGLVGLILLLMMLATDHEDTHWNLIALLLHPMWWLLLLPLSDRWRVILSISLLLAMVVGGLLLAWPGLIQDRPVLMVLLMPILGATLWGHWREARSGLSRSSEFGDRGGAGCPGRG
jgi:hypothetical protein